MTRVGVCASSLVLGKATTLTKWHSEKSLNLRKDETRTCLRCLLVTSSRWHRDTGLEWYGRLTIGVLNYKGSEIATLFLGHPVQWKNVAMNITVLNIIMQMGAACLPNRNRKTYQSSKRCLEGPPRRNSLVSERSGWSFPIMKMPIKSSFWSLCAIEDAAFWLVKIALYIGRLLDYEWQC